MNDQPTTNQPTEVSHESLHNQKVLIIEDEEALARAMEIKLTKSGIHVKAVFEGKAGLAELRSNHYDLLLLDLMMPEFDGWMILEAIKNENIATKILVTSNLTQDEDIRRAKELGATDFLVKSNHTLAEILERAKEVLFYERD